MPTDVAEKLSQELYHLSRPAAIRDPRDVTTHWCGWIPREDDPTQCVLSVEDAEELPVHPQATLIELSKVYADEQTKGDATKGETDAIKATITGSKNQRLPVDDALTAKWKAAALTREQAIAGGWLPDMEQPPA